MNDYNLSWGKSLRFVVLSLIINSLGIYTPSVTAAGASTAGGSANNRAEVVFTDSQAAVLRANTAMHGAQLVAMGQKLDQPFGICVCANGEYIVTDTGCVALI